MKNSKDNVSKNIIIFILAVEYTKGEGELINLVLLNDISVKNKAQNNEIEWMLLITMNFKLQKIIIIIPKDIGIKYCFKLVIYDLENPSEMNN